MQIETTLETTETLVLGEKDIERIVRESLGDKYTTASVSLYENTVPASATMGAIDDSTEIQCKVVLYSKTVTPRKN
jgi:hypothetical protein